MISVCVEAAMPTNQMWNKNWKIRVELPKHNVMEIERLWVNEEMIVNNWRFAVRVKEKKDDKVDKVDAARLRTFGSIDTHE